MSRTQSVGIDHNDVLLSVSFLSRINFRVAVGITEASGTPVLYKAFDWLVWRANIFGLAKKREECSVCLSRSESSHGKLFTLRRVVFSSVLSHSVVTTLLSTTSSWVRLTVAPVMKTRERKMQAWKPERGKCRHDCLRDSEKQTLEDKQVVQLRLHVRLLLHTSKK